MLRHCLEIENLNFILPSKRAGTFLKHELASIIDAPIFSPQILSIEEFDKYQGIELMMPRAKAVSAKSYDFDDGGEETTIDYKKMLDLIKAADYKGFIGIEYEGNRLSEADGIRATKALLEKYI